MKLSNRTLRLFVGGILFFSGLLVAPRVVLGEQRPKETPRSAVASRQAKRVDAPADGSASTEAETCKTCHEDITTSFEKSPHWKTMNDTRGGHSKQGCEACHGPGGDHADDPSKPVFDYKTATPEATTYRCYSCHLQQRAQFNMPFRHRVNEGLIQCTDCHNQHGTGGVLEGDHLVRQVRTSDSGDMVCFKCHADKQGPFVFEHAAVRLEGCGSCHVAHGGANAHMLNYSNVNL